MQAGRPRAFDLDEALDKALRVFWQKGFEGTSLPDLTAAMGINRPSLYAAFGNKEALFRKALDRYAEVATAGARAALDEPKALDAIRLLLQRSIESLTCPENPRGCLVVQGALSCGDAAAEIKTELAQRRAATETLIRERLERAHAEGDLPSHTNPADLARYIATLLQGLAVQAAGGVPREDLEAVVDLALAAWPTSPSSKD